MARGGRQRRQRARMRALTAAVVPTATPCRDPEGARAAPTPGTADSPRRPPPAVPLLDELPSDVCCRILSTIFIVQRLELRTICKAWRRWLDADARVWAECDLRYVTAVNERCILGLLIGAAAAAARSGGGLVRVWLFKDEESMESPLARDGPILPEDVLKVVCTGNGALKELYGATAASATATQWTAAQLRRLAAAAPELAVAELDVRLDSAVDAAELFASACGLPAGALRLRTLHISPCGSTAAAAQWTPATLRALVAGAAAADVTALHLFSMRAALVDGDPEALPALCCAAAANGLKGLGFLLCGLDGSSWRHLAEALQPGENGALTSLSLIGDDMLNAWPEQVAPFVAALRTSRLTQLHIEQAGRYSRAFGGISAGVAVAPLVAAAVDHATLRTLRLRNCSGVGMLAPDELGQALAAAAATLRELDVSHCRLRDDTVAPLLEAIMQPNCTLRRLTMGGSGMSDAFMRGALVDAAARVAPKLEFVLPKKAMPWRHL